MQPICLSVQSKYTWLGHHRRAGCAAISHKEESDLYRSVSVIGSGIRYEEDVLKAPIMSSVLHQKKEFLSLSSGIQFFVEI